MALTVDVEGDFGTERLDGVDQVLPALLDGFEERGARATFFVVGEVARRRPDRVRELVERGHEVGSHGMTHATLSSLDAAARAATLEDSRACLEEITGAACAAFRAPYFDLPKGLGPVIEEAGYRWSSSKAPFSPVARYRHLLACRRPHLLAGSEVHEVPVPGFLGLPIPEGLSYRRLFWPLSALPARPPRVFYLHPWELLESVDSHDLPRWARALTRWRSGRWAARHLWAWLDAWIARGAVIEPPELPSGAATAAGPPPPPR